MKDRSSSKSKNPIEIIEEGLHLLLSAPFSLLFYYYTGSLPFLSGFLFFWSDMSMNALAEENLDPYAFIMLLLFIWMRVWHMLFCRNLFFHISRQPPEERTGEKIFTPALNQVILHSTGLVVLPSALLLIVTFPTIYAFYQNITFIDATLGKEEKGSIRHAISRSWMNATMWHPQNILILIIVFSFSVFVFINIGLILILLPHLLKTLLGIDTILSLSIRSFLNTTFLICVLSLSVLVIDPLLKAIYVLRCFYSSSLSTGKDILIDLRTIQKKRILACTMLLMLIGSYGKDVHAEKNRVPPLQLKNSIEKTLDNPEYIWRSSESFSPPLKDRPGIFQRIFSWCSKKARTISSVIEKIGVNLKRLMEEKERDPSLPQKKENGIKWISIIRWLSYGVLLIFLLVVTYILKFYILKYLAHRKNALQPEKDFLPDIEKKEIPADAIPSEEWSRLAESLRNEGDLRLSMRAFYFSTLSMLSDRKLIAYRIYKSNREYSHEILRGCHGKEEMGRIFSDMVSQIEAVWYGNTPLTMETLTSFINDCNKVIFYAVR